MAAYIQEGFSTPASLHFIQKNAILHCGDKSYTIGRLESLDMNVDGSCSLNATYGQIHYTISIPAQKAETVIKTFLNTWDRCHKATLHTYSQLKTASYNTDTWQWEFVFEREGQGDHLDLLKASLQPDQNSSLYQQWTFVASRITRLLQYQAQSTSLDPTVPITIIPKDPEPLRLNPLTDSAYTLNEEGILCWRNHFWIVADFLTSTTSQLLKTFANALLRLGNDFPLSSPPKLGHLILTANDGELHTLRSVLQLPKDLSREALAAELDAILLQLYEHQQSLLTVIASS